VFAHGDEENEYGPAPLHNTRDVIAAAWLSVIAVLLLGVAAGLTGAMNEVQ
jgi:hypothetical protein